MIQLKLGAHFFVLCPGSAEINGFVSRVLHNFVFCVVGGP